MPYLLSSIYKLQLIFTVSYHYYLSGIRLLQKSTFRVETLSYGHHHMAENDKCWSSLSLPNLSSRNLDLQQKPSWDTFTVVHLLLNSLRCSRTLTPCKASPEKGCHACRSYLPLLPPWELSGTTTENKQMEGMSQKPVEILTVRWQKPLQADKISCPTWNKRCTRASYIYIRSLANFAETTCGCSSSLLPAGHTGTWCSDFR